MTTNNQAAITHNDVFIRILECSMYFVSYNVELIGMKKLGRSINQILMQMDRFTLKNEMSKQSRTTIRTYATNRAPSLELAMSGLA